MSFGQRVRRRRERLGADDGKRRGAQNRRRHVGVVQDISERREDARRAHARIEGPEDRRGPVVARRDGRSGAGAS